ncbi:asparagine synthase [Phormidium sp. FACHB-592]|uniref:asparagine synthase (glutamine-hydrolyzing) n=1 Tax=Stenomitos frigidus AS-A4 TaxID=2933935 RepID=A0ABV0KID3_9CYAN|nr:asparagine synthetase B family protein [Phormidium sp. FACHB-592]MBD2075703.1 asparagine synthase [Phormidium sp. FACHB-592]
MGHAIPLQVFKGHQVIGYWGFGTQVTLEQQLTNTLRQLGEPFCQKNVRRCGRSPQIEQTQHTPTNDAITCVWGAAYLGWQPTDCNRLPEGTIAALSASGLGDGSGDTLDAWATVDDQCLHLGREPFGHVLLYWTQMGQVLWFASRPSLLLPLIEAPQISIPAVYGYSCFSYVPTPLTPIAQIHSIAAGTEQTWIADSDSRTLLAPSVTRSLEWQEAPEQIQEETLAIAELRSLLKDAVARQITDLNDEPVGVLLSGGLDSSIVAALLVEAGVKVRAYTLDFGADSPSESSYAAQVAEFLNIPLVKVDASPRCIRQALRATAQALDVPFGDGVTVPLFLLMQAASQDVQVIFNGEGGDQLFAGWTNKPLIAADIYRSTHQAKETFERQYLRTFHRLWGYENQLFQPDFAAQMTTIMPEDWLQDALNPAFSTTLLHRLRRATLMLKGAQNIHPRATNLGMAHGLQVRSPFCDLPLAQWSFQVSGTLHLQAACEKYILKRAVEPWLPPEIVWRQKRGMGVPLNAWCFNELWQELGWLQPDRLRKQGIWQPQVAARIAAGTFGTLQGRRIGESLWLLLMWQVWHDTALGSLPAFSLNHPFWLPSSLGRLYLQLQRERQQW